MSTDTFACPRCGVPLRRTAAALAGVRVRCPGCELGFLVPPPGEPAVSPLQAAPAMPDEDTDADYLTHRIEGELRNDYTVDLGKWFVLGVRHWGALIGPFIGYCVVVGALMVPMFVIWPLLLLALPQLLAGQTLVALKILKGRPWSFADFFGGFHWYRALLTKTLLLSLVGLGSALPVLAVYAYAIYLTALMHDPGAELPLLALVALALTVPAWVYFSVRFYWALWLVLDRNYGGPESLAGSWRLTRGRFWITFAVWLLVQAIQSAGAAACYVGLLFAQPLALLVTTAGYLLIAGSRPPVEEPERPTFGPPV